MTTTDHGTQPPSGRRLRLRKRALLAWASLFAVGALITTAGFVDSEWSSSEVSTGSYDLQISKTGQPGSWQDQTSADAPLQVDMVNEDGAQLIPGGSGARSTVHIKNVGDYRSTLVVEVDASGDQAFLSALEFTVTPEGGPAQQVTLAQLGDGYTLPEIAVGDTAQTTVTATLPDGDASNALQGKQVQLIAAFNGESIAPLSAGGA